MKQHVTALKRHRYSDYGSRGVLIVLLLMLLTGCQSKQEEKETLESAARIHSQLQRGDFSAIYEEASPILRKEMEESVFVAGLKTVYKDNGPIKNRTPIAFQRSHDLNLGSQNILLFDVAFERITVRERMVFIRSQSNHLELVDLVIDRIGG